MVAVVRLTTFCLLTAASLSRSLRKVSRVAVLQQCVVQTRGITGVAAIAHCKLRMRDATLISVGRKCTRCDAAMLHRAPLLCLQVVRNNRTKKGLEDSVMIRKSLALAIALAFAVPGIARADM